MGYAEIADYLGVGTANVFYHKKKGKSTEDIYYEKKFKEHFKEVEDDVIDILVRVNDGETISDLELDRVVSFFHWDYLKYLKKFIGGEFKERGIIKWVWKYFQFNDYNLDMVCDDILTDSVRQLARMYVEGKYFGDPRYTGVLAVTKRAEKGAAFKIITERYFESLREICDASIEFKHGEEEFVSRVSKEARKEIKKVLFQAGAFSQREIDVLGYRYGFYSKDGSGLSLDETAKIFNVTRQRIKQIEERTLRKLRYSKRAKRLLPYYEELMGLRVDI